MAHFPEVPIQKYTKVSRDDFSGYWLDAYAWIACYFAQLEGLSYALIDLLSSDRDKARLKKLPFQDRTEQARTLVCAHLTDRGEVALADEWDAFFGETKAAAPRRNKILHNPLSINLTLGDPFHDSDAGILLVHEPDQPVLKLGAVQEFAKEVMELNKRMVDLLTRTQFIPCVGPSI